MMVACVARVNRSKLSRWALARFPSEIARISGPIPPSYHVRYGQFGFLAIVPGHC